MDKDRLLQSYLYIFFKQAFYQYINQMQKIPKCLKNNEGYVVCWTQNCKINPTICKNDDCECSISHINCLINVRVSAFFNRLKQLNKGVLDANKLKILMEQKLKKLREDVNIIIEAQIKNIDEYIKNFESEERSAFKKFIEGNQVLSSEKIEYYLNLKSIEQSYGERVNKYFNNIKDDLKKQLSIIIQDKNIIDYKSQFKGTDIQLKSFTNHSIQFQYKANGDKHQTLILPKALKKTTKLFIHATNLTISSNKPYWFYAGIINKTNIDFNTGNYNSSIVVSTQDQLYGNMKKIQGNGIQQKNECLYELEYNKQSNYFQIKIGSNKYRLDNLPTSEYYVIIGMYTQNSMVRIYE